jgi:hypothetical protein
MLPRAPLGEHLIHTTHATDHVVNTPAHLIVGAAVFGRVHEPRITTAAVLGALLPDVSLFVMTGWSIFVQGIPSNVVFNQLYFSEQWQSVFAIDNSFPLWGVALAIAVAFRSRVSVAFTGAGLLHLLSDFLLHHEDARQMLVPFTNWIFRSPVSYWDPRHYGRIAAPIEIVMSLLLCTALWRRMPGRRARVMIFALALAEVVPALISLTTLIKR